MENEIVSDAYCLNCIYYRGDVWYVCNYYLDTDIRRPCPGGKGCTVRVLRKRRRKLKKWRAEDENKI